MIESIDIGLDIQFKLYDKEYCIGWEKKGLFIAECPDGSGIIFKNAVDLIEHFLIEHFIVNGKPLKEVLNDMKVYSLI